jgi:hypothetical protein
MNIKLLDEPLLQFGTGDHICPKEGIRLLNPYDLNNVRPERIRTGIIGKSDSVGVVQTWLNRCKHEVEGKKSSLTKLFTPFMGFNKNDAFKAEIIYDEGYVRKINNSDFDQILIREKNYAKIVQEFVELYVGEIRFLAKNKNPDVILCVLSEKFIQNIIGAPVVDEENNEEQAVEPLDELDAEEISEQENNFRRLLKARAMEFNVPIQIVRDRIAKPSGEMQDPASIAWNFFTALYYKSSGTPWAMKKKDATIVCYAGISFYKSRNSKTTQTSITQIFNEHGKGVILRGSPVQMKKGDKEPHLTEDQAYELLDHSLKEYYEALKVFPQRLVLHKTSNFNSQEIEGFKSAAYKNNINAIDLVTIMETPLRLYRQGIYPPLRGTLGSFDEKNHVLYTRGFVPFYNTYPGAYIPNPIGIRLFSHDESPELICSEIMSLTKMNWNNTQFDRKLPITVECSKKVGEILKYLDQDQVPQIKYSFYM